MYSSRMCTDRGSGHLVSPNLPLPHPFYITHLLPLYPTPSIPHNPLYHTPSIPDTHPQLWTDKHEKNITFPQLPLRAVIKANNLKWRITCLSATVIFARRSRSKLFVSKLLSPSRYWFLSCSSRWRHLFVIIHSAAQPFPL